MEENTLIAKRNDAAAKIALQYAGFAALWIVLSDRVVAWIFTDIELLTFVSTAKGWLFVAVTTLLLFVMIRRLIQDFNHSLQVVTQKEEELRESIAQQKASQLQVTASHSKLQATLDALPDLLFEVGRDGCIYEYHSHRGDLLAAPPEAFLGRRFDEILPPEASAICRLAIEEAHCNGFSTGNRYELDLPQGKRWFDLSVSALKRDDSTDPRFIFIARDITAVKQYESELEHIAHFDTLTHLPNRLLLNDRLHQAMAQSVRRGEMVVVAYIDLDDFKSINDRWGNEIGDRLLVALSQRLGALLRDGDTFARIGGDEFVAVLADLENVEAGIPLISRLITACAEPFLLEDQQVQTSISVGLTRFPQETEIDAEQLLRQADQAMYQSKVAGKNRYFVFDTRLDSQLRDRSVSVERIRVALNANEFVLYYQPKVNMRTSTVVGAEALIRWLHPEKGLVPPAMFLPAIQDHPLSIDVGEWVLETAIRQTEQWQAEGLRIPVSVNIGALQLQQPDFVQKLQATLARHPLFDPAFLQLEILETSALQDTHQVTAVIDACKRMGVVFALDDFGTGYSSLTHLRQLPVAVIKIDQSFVRNILFNLQDQAILQGVLGLASAFGLSVIAEGVESWAHGSLLLKLGCEDAQGYGIARPMPGDEIPTWTQRWLESPQWTTV